MELDSGLREQLVHAAFHKHLAENNLSFMNSEHFVYLAKQLSQKDNPTHSRALDEMSKFFSPEELGELIEIVEDIRVTQPGVYATQLSENESAFPEYFVFDRAKPGLNFFVKFYHGSEMTEKLSEHFEVKLLSAKVPEKLDIKLSLS